MGYIRHDAVVAVLGDCGDRFNESVAAIEALREEMGEEYAHNLLGPSQGVNGYVTYVLTPDGSKEGWEHSNEMDEYRRRFIECANISRWPSIVHLQLGGDDGETKVLFTTDMDIEE